jgi:hypothetical protein
LCGWIKGKTMKEKSELRQESACGGSRFRPRRDKTNLQPWVIFLPYK